MLRLSLWLKGLIPKRIRFRIRCVVYDLRALFYAGSGVFCPWCDRHFRRFVQYGTYHGPNLNTLCPKCGGFERHRLQWLYFNNKTRLFEDRFRVLHLGPEYGPSKKLRSMANLDYVSADLDSPLAMVHMDITRMPYPDDSFDVILCNHVLEHIKDDLKAMAELYRVLRRGGWAVILVPLDKNRSDTLEDPAITSPHDRERYYLQADHVRLYGRDFIQRLRNEGFEVEVNTYAAGLDPGTIKLFGINSEEELYICKKVREEGSLIRSRPSDS
jgi:SAM-dependent methyltransferase